MLAGEDGTIAGYEGGCRQNRSEWKCTNERLKEKGTDCYCSTDLCNASYKIEIPLIATLFAAYLTVLYWHHRNHLIYSFDYNTLI